MIIELPNLVINPSKHKIIFSNDYYKWQYYTIPQLIESFKVIVEQENLENRSLLDELISEVFCLYLELKECRRYNEDKTFSRIGKDYEIIDLINKLIQKNEGEIIVGTNSAFERNIFQREIERLGITDSLEVKTIDQLNKSTFERQNFVLVLCRPSSFKILIAITFAI